MNFFPNRDTAGQERFRSVTRSYYRGAAGALLVYDIASRDSFNSLQNWLSDARNLASPNIVIILVGNKKDLESHREVSYQEASQFAKDNGEIYFKLYLNQENEINFFYLILDLIFVECSALNGELVEEAFLKCARIIMTSIESGQINPERIGSGIQNGDLSLRNLQRTNEKQKQNNSNCYNASCNI